MARCETCGNDYDKSFQVIMNGESHTFDSFECAIHELAPTCPHCCCAHCAKTEGVRELRDRA
jgi:hypothetical protein